MDIIKLAKEAGFTVTGSRIESPYIGGSDISQRLAEFAALVLKNEADETRARFAQPERPEALAEPVKQEPVAWWNGTKNFVPFSSAPVDAKAILEMRDKAFQSYVDQVKADRELSVLQARLEALEEAAKWLAESGLIGSNDCAAAIRSIK